MTYRPVYVQLKFQENDVSNPTDLYGLDEICMEFGGLFLWIKSSPTKCHPKTGKIVSKTSPWLVGNCFVEHHGSNYLEKERVSHEGFKETQIVYLKGKESKALTDLVDQYKKIYGKDPFIEERETSGNYNIWDDVF